MILSSFETQLKKSESVSSSRTVNMASFSCWIFSPPMEPLVSRTKTMCLGKVGGDKVVDKVSINDLDLTVLALPVHVVPHHEPPRHSLVSGLQLVLLAGGEHHPGIVGRPINIPVDLGNTGLRLLLGEVDLVGLQEFGDKQLRQRQRLVDVDLYVEIVQNNPRVNVENILVLVILPLQQLLVGESEDHLLPGLQVGVDTEGVGVSPVLTDQTSIEAAVHRLLIGSLGFLLLLHLRHELLLLDSHREITDESSLWKNHREYS